MSDQAIHTMVVSYCRADCKEHGRKYVISNSIFSLYVGMDNSMVYSWRDRELRLPQHCPACDGVVIPIMRPYIANKQ